MVGELLLLRWQFCLHVTWLLSVTLVRAAQNQARNTRCADPQAHALGAATFK